MSDEKTLTLYKAGTVSARPEHRWVLDEGHWVVTDAWLIFVTGGTKRWLSVDRIHEIEESAGGNVIVTLL